MTPAKRRRDDQGDFINFEEAGQQVDPAVNALLSIGERKRDDARLPQKEREKKRKEREKMQARRAQHTTYDIPVELRQKVKELAKREGVPASQIAALALLRLVQDLESGAVELAQFKEPSRSPRYDYNLVVPGLQRENESGRRR